MSGKLNGNFLTVNFVTNPVTIDYSNALDLTNFSHCSVGSYNINNQSYNIISPTNQFIYQVGAGAPKAIQIPEGGYSLTELSTIISLLMTNAGDSPIQIQNAGAGSLFLVIPATYTVSFSPLTIYKLLGFPINSTIGPFPTQQAILSSELSDFSVGVQSYVISTNLVNQTYVNGLYDNNLFTLMIDKPYGFWMAGSPPREFFVELYRNKVQKVTFGIKDNLGNFVNFNNTVPVVTFHFKKLLI